MTMHQLLVLIGLVIHAVASFGLMVFGLHRLMLGLRLRRVANERRPPPPPLERTPIVTVQIPLFNEMFVAERAVRAAAALDYPRECLEIQILDDSTDSTSTRVSELVARLSAEGLDIKHCRRVHRTGYKAGALAAGLATARGEFIALFDADFLPQSEFLHRCLPHFADPTVGMVQARWDHLNADTSLLTKAQALQLDAHFTAEHGVRFASGCFFNFNGTAGVWRRAAIEEAGGWQADTLTEDLDLSYRAQLVGWRFVYRDDIAVPAELPADIAAYRQQQQRWTQGGIETARKILPSLLRADLPSKIKRAAAAHLLIHLSYPLLVSVAVTGLFVGLLAFEWAARWIIAVDGTVLMLATGSLSYFYGLTAFVRDRATWRRRLLIVPVVMLLGAGIAVSQSAAVWRGLVRARTPFMRTPKYRISGNGRAWRHGSYAVPVGVASVLECATGAVLLTLGTIQGFQYGSAPSALVLLCGLGLFVVGAASLAQRNPRGVLATDPRSGPDEHEVTHGFGAR